VDIISLTSDNFQSEVLQSSVPVLIDFWASWCGPCKMIGPLTEQIAGEYTDNLKVCKVNVDEEGSLAEQHGIVSIPTLIVYKDGALVAKKNGAAPKHDIEALFTEAPPSRIAATDGKTKAIGPLYNCIKPKLC
jgi:thioredoxin 1